MKVDKSKKRERSASPKVKKPKRKYRNDRSKKSRHSDSSDSSDSSGKESMSESESSEEDKRVSKKSKKPKPRYSKRRTRSSSDSSRSPSPEKRKKVTKTSSRRSDSDSEDDKDEKRRLKKKVKKRSPSPKKKRSPTPKKKRSPSPKRKRSPTPKRKRSPTPKKKRSPTPKKRRSPSPKKKRSPSPKKKRSLSPKKKRSPSPKKKRSLSPKKKRSPSPKKKRSLSPKKKRSPTPKKKRSPTPKRKRKESESPPRKRKTRKPSDSPPRRRKRSPTPDKKKRRSKSPRRRRSRSPSKEKRRRKKSRSESKEKKSKRASSSSESPPRRRKDRSRSKSKDRRSRKSPDRRRRRRSRDESESDRSSSESPIRKEKEKTKKRRSPTPDKKKNRRSRSVERKRKERSRSIEKKRKKSKSRSTTPVESRKVKELKERSKARSPSTDKKPLIKQDKSSSPVLKKRKERSESPETKKSETAEIESNGTVKKDSNNKVSVDQKQTVNNGHAKETSIKEDSLKSTPPIKKDTKVGDATNTKTEETNVKETKDSENKNIGKSTEVEVSKTLNEDCKIESSKGKNLVKEEVKPEGLEVKEEPKKNIKKDEITPEINKLNKEKPDKVKPKIEIVKITKSQVSKAKEEKSSVNSNKEVGKIRVKDEIKKEDERKDSKTSKDAVNKILLKDKIKEEMNHIKKEIKSREDSKSRESKADRDLKARSEKDSQRRSRDSGRDYRDSSRDSSRRKDDSKSSKKEKSPDRKKELSSIEEEMKKRKERIEAWRNARKQQNGETDDVKEVKDKKWSLEDDDDEEETQNKDQNKKTADQKIIKQEESEDEDLDPLDAYMKSINKEINKIAPAGKKGSNKPTSNGKAKTITVVTTVLKKAEVKVKPEVMEQNQDALEYSSEEEKPEDVTATDFHDIKKRKKDLEAADHSKIYYAPFKRDFYVEVPELTRMTPDEVKLYRESLGDIQVRGKNVPKPIKAWSQAGLNTKIMNVLKKCNYEKPTPIQAQAIPTVMSGRDMIGIAKTGSGKTLAFVLPMLRHCLYQPALDENDGPIAIMMTPTRELALQIYKETRKFCKPLKLTVACIYGGSGISEQIAELKKGAEIIVCTPGRMIDMLSANNGKVTNCRRCTYLVLDEADRMFDMGFEPQVMRIIDNIRPDRQTVLFSATFPRQMEAVARKVLKKPVEIQVGGRSIVCSDVEQHALVIDADNKFLKLLELLGVYSEQGSCLVFVEKQETADTVFKDLLKKGYPCLSLHGGMDQFDRDSTIADFKNGVMKIMVSTSVAARGLDVKKLILVVNYDCPNHYEDYVHRVGRTGRAGNKGTAFTLLTYEQGRNAGDIVKAFELSKREPPEDVLALWNGYKEQMEKEGKKVKVNSGFSGKGFKFNADEEAQVSDAKKMQKFALGMQDSDDEAEAAENAMEKIEADLEKAFSNKPKVAVAPEVIEAKKVNQQILKESGQNVDKDKLSKASNIAALLERKLTSGQVVDRNTVATAHIMQGGALESLTGVGLAKQLADKVNAKLNYKAVEIEKDKEETKEANVRYEEEIDINDFPQQARWRITSKEIIEQVREISEAGVTVRGIYIPPNKKANEDEKRLHLYIESLNERSIQIAKAEIKRLLKEELIKAESHSYRPQQTGRYKVV